MTPRGSGRNEGFWVDQPHNRLLLEDGGSAQGQGRPGSRLG